MKMGREGEGGLGEIKIYVLDRPRFFSFFFHSLHPSSLLRGFFFKKKGKPYKSQNAFVSQISVGRESFSWKGVDINSSLTYPLNPALRFGGKERPGMRKEARCLNLSVEKKKRISFLLEDLKKNFIKRNPINLIQTPAHDLKSIKSQLIETELFSSVCRDGRTAVRLEIWHHRAFARSEVPPSRGQCKPGVLRCRLRVVRSWTLSGHSLEQ